MRQLKLSLFLLVTVVFLFSFNSGTALADDTGWVSPSANNGAFTNPTNAYADETGFASSSARNSTHRYWGYDFSAIPDGAVINGIEVRLDAEKNENTPPPPNQNMWLAVEISNDLGITYTTGVQTANLGTTFSTYLLGGGTALWGLSAPVSASSIKAPNSFRIRITCGRASAGGTFSWHLDWAPVKIYYSTIVDTDGDGIADSVDNCPNTSNANQADADGDGVGNVCDNCPNTSNANQADADGDGVGNVCDNCPNTSNATQTDTDGDGVGDACDICPGSDDRVDADADGVPDGCDNCPNISNATQTDTDGDGVGDTCDICPGSDDEVDADADGVPDGCDNCPAVSNATQTDTDGDGVGDTCDICAGSNDTIDTDADGVPDGCDVCAGSDDAIDTDSDGVPDGCDICAGSNDTIDTDADGVPDGCDICPGSDDAVDADSDGVPDGCDNCPAVSNADQTDSDTDGIGDVCDDDDGDGSPSSDELLVPDADGAGFGDGNGDGTSDSSQPAVTSLRTINGGNQWATIENNTGCVQNPVTAIAAPGDVPSGVEFPYGFFEFTLTCTGCTDGGAGPVEMTLYFPYDQTITGYWKKDNNGAWQNIASEIGHVGTVKTWVKIILTDNGIYDEDDANCIITDGSGPGRDAASPSSIPTMTEWGMIILSLMMVLTGIAYSRRKEFIE